VRAIKKARVELLSTLDSAALLDALSFFIILFVVDLFLQGRGIGISFGVWGEPLFPFLRVNQ